MNVSNQLLKTKQLFIFFLLIIFYSNAIAQDQSSNINILFYNVENLFDITDDPNINDEEFLPSGDRHWTKKRFEHKLNQLSKVILASCDYEMPDIVGFCEVENRYVLEKLTQETALYQFDYQIIHKESPDERGIDVALIYKKDQLIPIKYNYIPLVKSNGKIDQTREILHATFQIEQDTLHVFFNHWPSRYNGQAGSEPLRILAAQTLKSEVDKLITETPDAQIVIMGDFNDEPQNKSIKEVLTVNPISSNELINLSANWNGTLKYQQNWQVFDQIIVSNELTE